MPVLFMDKGTAMTLMPAYIHIPKWILKLLILNKFVGTDKVSYIMIYALSHKCEY